MFYSLYLKASPQMKNPHLSIDGTHVWCLKMFSPCILVSYVGCCVDKWKILLSIEGTFHKPKVMLPHVKDAFAKVMLPHVKVAFATYHHHHHLHKLCEMLCTGEGLEYRPFHDLRSVPEAGTLREQVENQGRACCSQVLYLCKAELGFYHFLDLVTGLVGTFSWSEDPSTAWLVPSRRSHLLGTCFFREVKGAENTKEKSMATADLPQAVGYGHGKIGLPNLMVSFFQPWGQYKAKMPDLIFRPFFPVIPDKYGYYEKTTKIIN